MYDGSKCINAIINVVMKSNMAESQIHKVFTRPVEYVKDKDGKTEVTTTICVSDSLGKRSNPLTEAWVAGNLLLFSAFDGAIENNYSLKEGDSFKQHYDGMPESNDFDIMTKNCYRVFKIIRNGIQHNLSNVNHSDADGSYLINYTHKGTRFSLQITGQGMEWLYTYVMNYTTGSIEGISKKYNTKGHYVGIMRNIYSRIVAEISNLSDEIGTSLLPVTLGLKLRNARRCTVINPLLVKDECDTVTFFLYEGNGTDDESNPNYQISSDYVYGDYLLPQELGNIIRYRSECLQERLEKSTIAFKKSDITDEWKFFCK